LIFIYKTLVFFFFNSKVREKETIPYYMERYTSCYIERYTVYYMERYTAYYMERYTACYIERYTSCYIERYTSCYMERYHIILRAAAAVSKIHLILHIHHTIYYSSITAAAAANNF
jgi:hypothetical protein